MTKGRKSGGWHKLCKLVIFSGSLFDAHAGFVFPASLVLHSFVLTCFPQGDFYMSVRTFSLSAALSVVGGLALLARPAQAQTIQTFTYTGSNQTFVVPTNVSSLTVYLWGAGGGSGGGLGGGGAFVSGTLSVTPAQPLTLLVGEGGLAGFGAALWRRRLWRRRRRRLTWWRRGTFGNFAGNERTRGCRSRRRRTRYRRFRRGWRSPARTDWRRCAILFRWRRYPNGGWQGW